MKAAGANLQGNWRRLSHVLLILLAAGSVQAAVVKKIAIPSVSMQKQIPATLILPDSYRNEAERFPVLYLLHGAGGNHTSWNEAANVAELADKYGMLILCPDGGGTSWYFDSPIDPAFQYETFLAEECVAYIDQHFRTQADRDHRALCGLSMGGHGALFLGIRHRDAFSIAVSLSGGVDIRPFPDNWDIKERLGSIDTHAKNWESHTVVNLAKGLKDGDLAIALDCGDQDLFLEVNRALHAQLLKAGITHAYIEKPGAHTWDYWKAAIRRQTPFIQEYFQKDQTTGRTHIGASLAWISYAAEDAKTSGKVHGPSRTYGTPEAEAVGRRYVRLDAAGEFVEFKVLAPADTIVLRYCIPDAPGGGGIDATLSLCINGKKARDLNLTSRYAWNYGDYPWSNDPGAGNAHHFFDEVQCFIPAVKAGDIIRLQKDAADSAEYYLIDFIELEKAPPPLSRPKGSLSVTDFGAVPDDGKDDSAAITSCLASARRKDATVWIPAGTFRMDGSRMHVGGVKVQGAGMWYSKLTGRTAMFEGIGEPVEFSDLAIFGEITHRDNESPDNAFNGNLGDGSVFSGLWVEHLKCGFWTTQGTKNLMLKDSRIRNVMADGLNFCDGTSRSTVENCHLRNTGDDALASWSPTGDWSSKRPCVENRFINNTIEQPWLANGIAVYGGESHLIAGNDIRETVISGAGIHVSSGFEAVPFSGTIRVERNRMIGAGGDCYIGDTIGGLWLYAKDSDVGAVISVEGLNLVDSSHSAITVHGPGAFREIQLNDLSIKGAGEYAVHLKPDSRGSLSMGRLDARKVRRSRMRNDGDMKISSYKKKEGS